MRILASLVTTAVFFYMANAAIGEEVGRHELLSQLVCRSFSTQQIAEICSEYELARERIATEVTSIQGVAQTNTHRLYATTNYSVSVVTVASGCQTSATVVRVRMNVAIMTARQKDQFSSIIKERLSRSSTMKYHEIMPEVDLSDKNGNAVLVYTHHFIFSIRYKFSFDKLSNIEWQAENHDFCGF